MCSQAVLVEYQNLQIAVKFDYTGGTISGTTAATGPSLFAGYPVVRYKGLSIVTAGTDND